MPTVILIPVLRRMAGLLALIVALGGLSLSAGATRTGDNTARAGLSLVENGAANGKPLYNIKADRVPIADVLKALFRKSGEEFSIDQDVAGTIDLMKNDASLDEIFDLVREQARPPLRIIRGKVTRVSIAYDVSQLAAQAMARMNRARAGGLGSGIGGYGGGWIPGGNAPGYPTGDNPFERRVSLSIPDDRPIALADALQMIERQVRVPIRLDRSLPRNARFSAVFTQTPLSFVLDAITKTGALKWTAVDEGEGYILIAPTDRLQVLVGDAVAGSYPAIVCPRCHTPLASSWGYCPLCGQVAPRTPQNRMRPAPVRPERRPGGSTGP